MATNKNALIRYKTIDKCLQNRGRKWTLNDLIEACSDALYEFEAKDTYVSKRTVQLDIQNMRSDKLGYNAPIVVTGRKYYTYEDENYTITNTPINQLDMQVLNETVEMLSQFKDFSLFSELSGIIQKLEDRIYSAGQNKASIIHLEKNENLKGLKHLETLYQSILKKFVVDIEYQSFKARSSSTIKIHGYILKEYNNRWFFVGRKDKTKEILTLALDRIQNIKFDLETDYLNLDFNADNYYKDTYGVTVMNESAIINIELKIDKSNAPYVITKPFHKSQRILEQHNDQSITIALRVHHNFEIERLILGFGESIEVLKPRKLRSRIKKKLDQALQKYIN